MQAHPPGCRGFSVKAWWQLRGERLRALLLVPKTALPPWLADVEQFHRDVWL